MGYSQFLNMIPEAILVLMLIITFVMDFILGYDLKKKEHEGDRFNTIVSVMVLALTAVCFVNVSATATPVVTFGGMYVATQAATVMKTILAVGTLIVCIQARQWLSRPDTSFKAGEFYMLVESTLLGMFMMMSAGHFLMFFLGLEMASVPMACLVGLDKYRHNSAEAAAKYILTATFSSGVMLFGISLLYAATGTLYFDDFTASLTRHIRMYPSALSIVGLVFFFSGLGFKISLRALPFLDGRHLSGCADHGDGLSECHLQGRCCLHPLHHSHQGILTDGGALGGTAQHRDCALHHCSKPLCHPSE